MRASKMLSETDKAYLAGLVDGEGSIVIEYCNNRRNTKLRMNVTNSHIGTLQELKNLFGGYLYVRQDKRINHKPIGQLGFTAKQAREILVAIYPYLKIKREQANLALQFAETLLPPHNNGRRLTEDELSFRASLKNQISKLNKRGV